MTKDAAKHDKTERKRWLHIFSAVFLTVVIIVGATSVWLRSTRRSSERTVNEMAEFYLGETAERNSRAIIFELEKWMQQLERIVTNLSPEDLSSEQRIRDFVGSIQQINGADLFALVDEQGKVYTSGSVYPDGSAFSFLSKPITQPRVGVERSYENGNILIIALPVASPAGANIPVSSCFLGLTMENLISAMELNGVDNKTICRLFKSDGENLLNVSAEYPNSRNLFDVWEETAEFAQGYSLEAIRQDWENGREGYAVYSVKDAGNTYVYYRPIAHMGLYFTVVMRESHINEIVDAGARRMSGYSIGYCLVLVALLGCILLMVVRLYRADRRNQLEKDQLKIVGALSREYIDVFLADPRSNLSITIKSNGRMIPPNQRANHVYSERWEYLITRYVLEEEAEAVRRAVTAENLCARMEGLSEYDLDFRIKKEDGIHYCHVKFVRMDAGEDRFIVGLRNNDAQVRAEQERQKVLQDALAAAQHANRAKTTFLSHMSHDIRTPMNAIIGFTNIALKQQPKPEVRGCLEKIGESSEHLLTLINDVLDISRIEGGKVKSNPVPVDLTTVTDAALDITRGFLLNRDLRFHVKNGNVDRLCVLADPVRIREVLVNILSNAVKFTNDGGSVTFETACRPGEDAHHVVVSYRVSDTGVGMSEEFLERIFDDFSQEENGARTQYKGTGLGMAITKKYVDMMGGTISVESKKGVGSTFTVELPLELTTMESAAAREEPPMKNSLDGIRVLLAEDNALNAEIAEIQLEELGMTVTHAVDGKQAVEFFTDSPAGSFDVILMDIMMPKMDGYEATKAIRTMADRPDGRTVPIIAMTANAFAEDVQKSLEAGMNGHLSKPIVMDEVVKIIARNLNR